MAPIPEEHNVSPPVHVTDIPAQDKEFVAISGFSGVFPECANVQDLDRVLYNKENPINTKKQRWTFKHPELPEPLGKIPDLKSFDAQFFRVHFRLGTNMDPMSRILLEQTYQAIYDAGVSPKDVWGKRIGVYIGSCFSETEKAAFYVGSNKTGFGIAGCAKAMFANRISYSLNLKGPSLSIDAACSSTMIALERAYESIIQGVCEAAIVGGANICLHPQSGVHYGRIINLCDDGKTKSFDKNADGCARSEAISVIFLQKAKDAKRIYARLCHVKSTYAPTTGEMGQIYGPYRDPIELAKFYNSVYDEAGVSPSAVEYVEAFGSAVAKADRSELEAMNKVFCKDRKKPLLVGSVMSNIGYSEAASGNNSLIKVLLGYHHGELASNLHCENPIDDIEALRDGRMQIVREHTKFNSSYVGVNSMSIGGVNVHVLLHGHHKQKDPTRYLSNIPHLVTISGRHEAAVAKILNDIKSRPVDPEEIGLLHHLHETNISGHLGRGFTLLSTNEENTTVALAEKADYYDEVNHPLWFVYSGMGSQWAGMGIQLMRIPIFAAAIERCRIVLEPKGIDIVHIITSTDKTIFDNILHSFVGIAAIQIGLTDVLKAIGIVPDMIIGHSVGELGCAYADGCLTAEEMILSAYSRGLVSVQTKFIHGSMAAVGIGYQKIVSMLPPEIEVACHNSAESCTISGPSDKMREFVTKLTEQGIFAKEVPCSNIAYHSRYIQEAGPGLLKYLKEVIKSPKQRSERWLSTSVPKDKWETPDSKLCSAEYHTNNLLNPVLFEETSSLIPSNAVLIEIAPHGLLQAILKRSLPESCINVPLTRRGHADNTIFLLEAIGKLYLLGYNPQLEHLYPKIDFPVSTGTPHLSHLVEWEHSESWILAFYAKARRRTAAATQFILSVLDDEDKYLTGHIHDHKNVFPYSAALVYVWDTIAMYSNQKRRQVSVTFQNVHFHQQLEINHDKVLKINVQIHKGNGFFEVVNENVKILSGNVVVEPKALPIIESEVEEVRTEHTVSADEIYKIFHSRGCQYKDQFKSIQRANEDFSKAEIKWDGNWVVLLDSMIQLMTLRKDNNGISLPRFVRNIRINLNQHHVIETEMAETNKLMEIKITPKSTSCGGIIFEDMIFQEMPLNVEPISLKALKFVPFFQFNNVEVTEALNVFLQVVAENVGKDTINVVEIKNIEEYTIKEDVKKVANDIPGLKVVIDEADIDDINKTETLYNADLVFIRDLTTNDNVCEKLFRKLSQDIFVLTKESSNVNSVPQGLCRAVASATTPRGRLVLARWRPAPTPSASAAISVEDTSDIDLLESTRQSLRPDHTLIVLTRYPAPAGLKELVQKWRKEPARNKIHVAMINHKIASAQNLEQLPNFELAFNILDHGTWGGEFFVPATELSDSKDRNSKLRSTEYGDVNSLHWEETTNTGPNDIAVNVHYVGVNVVDAKKATGSIPYKSSDEHANEFGMDFSGITDSGERVMGVVKGGAASTRVAATPELLWPVPAHWSLEDAATVPLPYAQAIYCLGVKLQIFAGMTILVHGATGAFGLAVISIALGNGCKVFATVSSRKKKQFLRRVFPSIPEEHIGNSRDLTFGDMIQNITKHKGCNVAIGNFNGDIKNVALDCLGNCGIIFDTNQIPNAEDYQFGMNYLSRERNYFRVDFASMFDNNMESEMKFIQLVMSEGIAKGFVRPLSRVTYKPQEASRAFQLLLASRHRGRALIRINGEPLNTTAKVVLSPNSCQLVLTGDTDDTFVSNVIQALVDHGATNIVLNRNKYDANNDEYMQIKMKSWLKNRVFVRILNDDLSDEANAKNLINYCNSLGFVEGVFVISGKTDIKTNIPESIKNVDFVTRELCPSVKYFTVIGQNISVGQDVCVGRNYDRLPATLVTLPKLSFYNETEPTTDANDNMSYWTALEAVEQAIGNKNPIILAQVEKKTESPLLKRIAIIGDVIVSNNTPENVTLEQLGFKTESAEEISYLLMEYANVQITPENVAELTPQRIKEIDRQIEASNAEKVTGLNVLYGYVDSDELMATLDAVFVPTRAQNTTLRQDEFDDKETYMVIIPGIEGHYQRFITLSQRLKLPAVVLQPGLDHPHESPVQMAERMVKVLKKKVPPKQTFYLVGYSSGVLVALEMAAILEAEGRQGIVVCIDFSPDAFPDMLESILREAGATDENKLQDAIACHVYSAITGRSSEKIAKLLESQTTWNDKVHVCLQYLRGHVVHSSQYARGLFETIYGRTQQARVGAVSDRLSKNKLKSQLVLLKSKNQWANAEHDLGLSKYTDKTVDVYEIEKDHARALEDLNCSNLINRYLDTSLLEAYESKNLCETYLLNATTFMTSTLEEDD